MNGQARSDLPTGLSRPAVRALHGAGLHTLDDLAGRPGAELRALHGVGPAAVITVNAALRNAGLAPLDDDR